MCVNCEATLLTQLKATMEGKQHEGKLNIQWLDAVKQWLGGILTFDKGGNEQKLLEMLHEGIVMLSPTRLVGLGKV